MSWQTGSAQFSLRCSCWEGGLKIFFSKGENLHKSFTLVHGYIASVIVELAVETPAIVGRPQLIGSRTTTDGMTAAGEVLEGDERGVEGGATAGLGQTRRASPVVGTRWGRGDR